MANMGPIAQEIAVVIVKMMGTIVIISTAAVQMAVKLVGEVLLVIKVMIV